jgi:predicted Rossmann-fold nucleotide-binding protein
VWTLATLGVHAKPIVLLDVDGFYHGLLAWLTTLASQRFIRPEGLAMVRVARSVDEALDEVERFV